MPWLFQPALDGIDLPGIFTLKTIPDTREIKRWIDSRAAKKAIVVGGGFIGLEMAENLKNKGLRVSIIEMQPHVTPAIDEEMAVPIHAHLQSQGISLYTNSRAAGFTRRGKSSIEVLLESGTTVVADIVILAIGVRPEVALAKQAGLAIGELGGISVDDRMQTSDPNIWAVGDAVEVVDCVTGSNSLVPLAGPANRQGRMAANAILGREDIPGFRGVQATAVCGVLGLTIASTGASEKILRRISVDGRPLRYEKIYAHPSQHAQYYPGAKHMTIKLLFAPEDGRIFGAQAVGLDGVEKRIDVIAMALQKKGTVFDLEEAELCYAPQYGAAKDPVNMVGMIAANVVRQDYAVAHWTAVENSDALILDVRTPKEFERGHAPGAVNVPLENLRQRLSELPADRPIWTYCVVGQRSYFATRLLKQAGFEVKNLTGGYMMHLCVEKIRQPAGPKSNPFNQTWKS